MFKKYLTFFINLYIYTIYIYYIFIYIYLYYIFIYFTRARIYKYWLYECLEPLMVGDRCQRTDECQDMFGRAMCINERCECISSYHFVNETGKCIQTRCKDNYNFQFRIVLKTQ